jgi:imidazolonepropionase-like amidohydrolase
MTKLLRLAMGLEAGRSRAVTAHPPRLAALSQAFILPGLIDAHVHLASAPGRGTIGRTVLQTEADLALTACQHAQVTLQADFMMARASFRLREFSAVSGL